MKTEPEMRQFCERCGEALNPTRIVWLEFSQTDGCYSAVLPDGHVSQGGFAFGKACARRQEAEAAQTRASKSGSSAH